MIEIATTSPEQTLRLGEVLGSVLEVKDIVILSGDLGAGKTVLTRGIVRGLGGDPQVVRSPSYTYLNTYTASVTVHHLDLYLLDTYDDVYELGIEEMYEENSVIVIEWGDKFIEDYPKPCWRLDLRRGQESDKRQISIQAPSLEQEQELNEKWPF